MKMFPSVLHLCHRFPSASTAAGTENRNLAKMAGETGVAGLWEGCIDLGSGHHKGQDSTQKR